MNLLVLGGTVYLGRHLVVAAVEGGHRVTLFNRGQSAPGLFPDLEQLRGDREGDLGLLRNRIFDAIIDTSGYLPRTVRASANALANVPYYLFVSTISVYADSTQLGLQEQDPVHKLPPGSPEELSAETYGPLKAACEQALNQARPGRAAIVRPGLICGPFDRTDRSAYWPRRMSQGGQVLAPGNPERPIQLIDVRDLAAWMLTLCENRSTGIYNATGPAEPLTFASYLETCRESSATDPGLVWVDERFLLEQGVSPFSELPLWVPEKERAFAEVNCQKAIEAGLSFRPLVETVRAILASEREPAPPPAARSTRIPIGPSLTRAREAALLEAWRARGSAGHAEKSGA